MTIEVLLLDFGGVCLVHPHELHARTEEMFDLPAGCLTWLGAVDPSTDDLWRDIIAGRRTEAEYFDLRAAELSELAGRPISRSDYFTMLYDPPTPQIIRPEATDVVLSAKAAGYGVSVLTNDLSAFQGPRWQNGVAFFDLVDHVADCSLTGVYKPDPGAFHDAAKLIDAPLERMLFVDDQPRNVEGAEAVGLQSQWFDVANATESWASVAACLGLTLPQAENQA